MECMDKTAWDGLVKNAGRSRVSGDHRRDSRRKIQGQQAPTHDLTPKSIVGAEPISNIPIEKTLCQEFDVDIS
jgi:hypothetical protein